MQEIIIVVYLLVILLTGVLAVQSISGMKGLL